MSKMSHITIIEAARIFIAFALLLESLSIYVDLGSKALAAGHRGY
jgi:hypothetical protein